MVGGAQRESGMSIRAYYTSLLWEKQYGAGRENRTPMMLPSRDFESRASTNSAIPAYKGKESRNSLPFPLFRNFSRIRACDRVSNFSEYTNSTGKKRLVVLLFPEKCSSNLLLMSLVIPTYLKLLEVLFRTYTVYMSDRLPTCPPQAGSATRHRRAGPGLCTPNMRLAMLEYR